MSIIFSWWRFHKNDHKKLERQNDETEAECISSMDQPDLHLQEQDISEEMDDISMENDTDEEDLTQEEQLRMLERRLVYLLLTLQTVFTHQKRLLTLWLKVL